MIAVQGGFHPFSDRFDVRVSILDVLPDRQRLHIHGAETLFHGRVINFPHRIGEVPGISGMQPGHLPVGNGANLAFPVNRIGPDEKLVRFAMDHPVGGCAADAFRMDDLFDIRCDLVEPVVAAHRFVLGLGNDPEPIRPLNQSTRSALALIVMHRQMRIDAAVVFAGFGCG